MIGNLVKNKKVVVIGGGVIGASWAALFLASGMKVVIYDLDKNIAEKVLPYVENAIPYIPMSSEEQVSFEQLKNQLSFTDNLKDALEGADYVQENAPERVELKANLWKEVEEYAPKSALFMSSSSGTPATLQSSKMKQPERLIIGHPFNPPHLIPLVEVVPGDKQDEQLIQQTIAFYNQLGKQAKLVRKEINGFIANRLQIAIFRECVYLMNEGIGSVKDIDDVVSSSLGIRWATGGPFLSFHLGGGQGGIDHFLEHFAPTMESSWEQQTQADVCFDEQTKATIRKQVHENYGDESIQHLEQVRDQKELEIIKVLNQF